MNTNRPSDVQKEIDNCDLLWTNEHEAEVIKILASSKSGDVSTL